MAADILIEIEQGGEEDDGDDDCIGGGDEDESRSQTIYSRSSRGKTSFYSKGASKLSQAKTRKLTSNIHSDAKGKNTYAMTKKSHASVGSRMSKASMRDTKTNKTRNQKSVFTQKEEEYYPESLNVKHFDQ